MSADVSFGVNKSFGAENFGAVPIRLGHVHSVHVRQYSCPTGDGVATENFCRSIILMQQERHWKIWTDFITLVTTKILKLDIEKKHRTLYSHSHFNIHLSISSRPFPPFRPRPCQLITSLSFSYLCTFFTSLAPMLTQGYCVHPSMMIVKEIKFYTYGGLTMRQCMWKEVVGGCHF